MINIKKKLMQAAIDAAWNNPKGADLRKKLFPEGKPTSKVFIERISAYARQTMPVVSEQRLL